METYGAVWECVGKRCDVWLCLCETTKRGAWQKCVCALASVCVTPAAKTGFFREEENVTREQQYLISAATSEEMSTSTNTRAAEKESKAADGQN